MPSMIFVRHVCDRCAEQVELEVHPHAETPAKPEGWHAIADGETVTMLCVKCATALQHWLGTKPPPLSLVK